MMKSFFLRRKSNTHFKEISEYRGAIAASDERLLKAAEMVGEPPAGCDTADWLAETILKLRNEVQSLLKLTVDIAKDRDDAIKSSKDWMEQANTRFIELSALQSDLRCRTHRAVQLKRHVSYKNEYGDLCVVPKGSILIVNSTEENHWFCYFKTELVPILFIEANYWFKETHA